MRKLWQNNKRMENSVYASLVTWQNLLNAILTLGIAMPDWYLGVHLWRTLEEAEFNSAIDQFWEQRHAFVNQFINK